MALLNASMLFLVRDIGLTPHHDCTMRVMYQGDARYLISNSKDQSIKLWDIRKFSPKEGLAASRLAVTQQNWDYRWQPVPQRGQKRQSGLNGMNQAPRKILNKGPWVKSGCFCDLGITMTVFKACMQRLVVTVTSHYGETIKIENHL